MASIYNETMLQLYDRGELYKSKRSSMGKCGFWSKNCSYGYAHYNPLTKEFSETLGWEGVKVLQKRFKISLTDEEYFTFMKRYKLNYNWFKVIHGQAKKEFFKDKVKYMMLIKL